MLKYFPTIKQAQRYANSNCKTEELLIIIDNEARDNAEEYYAVINQEGRNHLDQMNWDYDILEVWE